MKAAIIVSKKKAVAVAAPPSKIKLRKIKKSVRFSPQCQVVTLTISRDEKTWYEKQEYVAFKLCNKEDVLAFAKAKKNPAQLLDGDRHCLRGLESYIPPTKKIEIESRKKQLVHAVLGHQLMQRSSGAIDPDSLAYLAEFLSKSSCDSAAERAQTDAKETWAEALAMAKVM
jgi:hypothetical protein